MMAIVDWIKVEERLPPKDFDTAPCSLIVLISDGQNISMGYATFEYYEDGDLDVYGTCWVDHAMELNCEIGGYAKVTHWAELPEPPIK